MASWQSMRRHIGHRGFLCAFALACLAALQATLVPAQQGKLKVLRIGTTGSLAAATDPGKDKAALESLQSFIKDETGLHNDILRQPSWRLVADKMAKGQLELGAFQGYEFAWAQAEQAGLKPLALAVNVYRYPVVHVVARTNSPAKDFGGLKGQSVALLPGEGPAHFFVERQSLASGARPEAFFSKIVTPENIEDALDDVVDG